MNKQEYYKKNVEWLEAKSKEEGVNALERGVFYKVLQSGPASGKQPGMTNVVVCHYRQMLRHQSGRLSSRHSHA